MQVEHGSTDQMVALVDTLQTLGVDPAVATRYAASFFKRASRPKKTFVEVYGTGNIVKIANESMRNLNLDGLSALDLRTCRPDGKPWDVRKRSHRVNEIVYY